MSIFQRLNLLRLPDYDQKRCSARRDYKTNRIPLDLCAKTDEMRWRNEGFFRQRLVCWDSMHVHGHGGGGIHEKKSVGYAGLARTKGIRAAE